MLPPGGVPADVAGDRAGAWPPQYRSWAQHLQTWVKRSGYGNQKRGAVAGLEGEMAMQHMAIRQATSG